MNLFALLAAPGPRIVRIRLTAELQEDMRVMFERQRDEFFAAVNRQVPFDGRYQPNDDEHLVIDPFEDIDGMSAAVQAPLPIDWFTPGQHDIRDIKAFFVGVENTGEQQLLIQRFETRRLLTSRGLAIFYSQDTFRKLEDAGLVFDTRLCAVLRGTALEFISFHNLRSIFDMAEYYREATDAEVRQFAAHEKFAAVDADAFVAAANTPIRGKISLVQQSGALDRCDVDHIVAMATRFHVPIRTNDNGKIVLPTTPVELRQFLRFLDEDYYESVLLGGQWISNSRRRNEP